jgi:hypothetical protein
LNPEKATLLSCTSILKNKERINPTATNRGVTKNVEKTKSTTDSLRYHGSTLLEVGESKKQSPSHSGSMKVVITVMSV